MYILVGLDDRKPGYIFHGSTSLTKSEIIVVKFCPLASPLSTVESN